MPGKLLLAIDQGTTGTTVMVADRDLKVLAKETTEYRQIYPKPGWVEHDPEDIWGSTLATLDRALRAAGAAGADPACIGITNQRETTLVWDRATGRPRNNAIVWQCRRTADICRELRERGHEERYRTKTGLVLDPYFSGTKLRWVLDNVPGLRRSAEAGEVAFGTVDTFLVWRLTGGKAHVTDPSNASRTLLFNLHSLSWDPELLAPLGVPSAMLPEVRSSAEVYGVTSGVPGLPDGIPISGIAGDQQAALFGQACFAPGDAKCTFGTGAFLLVNTGTKPVASRHGLLTTVAWRLGGETSYALEGSAFIAGAAVQFLRDGLKIINKASEIEALARSVEDSGGVVFVPALVGLGAPHWKPDARGLLCGLTRGTTTAHIARATLEGIALQNCDILDAMEKDLGAPLRDLRVDGGAAANGLLMQLQSDLLGRRVVRPRVVETTAMGALLLAGLGAGVFSGLDAVTQAWKAESSFAPCVPADRVARMRDQWNRAVVRA